MENLYKADGVGINAVDPKGRAKFARYVSLNILAMLGSSCYIIADTFFIANGVGADGLTALNLAISLFSYQQAIGLLIAIGSGTRFGVLISRGEKAQGNKVFTAAISFGMFIGFLIAVFSNIFAWQIAGTMGAKGIIAEMMVSYMRVILTCAPFYICNHILVAFIRNDGNPKLATIALLISNGSNIVLDYVFIYPMNLSMFGAALATGLAPIISICVLSLHFIKKKNSFRFSGFGAFSGTKKYLQIVSDFCRLGVPAMVNELSVGIVVMLFNFLFLGLGGNIAVAAYGVVTNVGLFAFAIFTGVSQGIQPLVSEYYGKALGGQLKIIRRDTVLVSFFLACALIGIAFLFTEGIVAVFNESGSTELKTIAEEGLRIYFISFLFGGINIAMSGYFSAMERADMGFVISLLRGLLIIAPAAVTFSKILGMVGIWMSVPVTEAVTFCVCLYLMRKTAAR